MFGTNATQLFSRRQLLKGASCGFGYLAFAALANQTAKAAAGLGNPLVPRDPHFAPRAKRVIFLFMNGGPSHVDTFDYKPELQRMAGKNVPQSFSKTNAKAKPSDTLQASPWNFKQHGAGGLWISDLYPHLAQLADDLCVINSMHSDTPAHIGACSQIHTGHTTFVRPSIGAWTLYGLGSENDSLPGFVTIGNLGRGGGAQNRGSAFLPAAYQGTPISHGTISHLRSPHFDRDEQRQQLDLMQSLNEGLVERTGGDSQLDAVIESFELAFRMQSVAPQVLDLNGEAKSTLEMYGIGDNKPTDTFGRNCLLARRMAEAGVRFIEVGDAGNWDHHVKLKAEMEANSQQTDQPIAALLKDLKQRNLLDETLVVCGGEFGRLPANGRADGRDHNNSGFTYWLAGGGVKGGISYGRTDEFGFAAIENKVHVHDLHATILHLLGLNHERLTYRYSGRDFRLTDVHGNVVKEILA